jgi:hypothetical protein
VRRIAQEKVDLAWGGCCTSMGTCLRHTIATGWEVVGWVLAVQRATTRTSHTHTNTQTRDREKRGGCTANAAVTVVSQVLYRGHYVVTALSNPHFLPPLDGRDGRDGHHLRNEGERCVCVMSTGCVRHKVHQSHSIVCIAATTPCRRACTTTTTTAAADRRSCSSRSRLWQQAQRSAVQPRRPPPPQTLAHCCLLIGRAAPQHTTRHWR